MSYIYLKKATPLPKKLKHPRARLAISSTKKRILATILFGVGFLTLFSAVYPLIRFQFEYSRKFGQIVNPLSARFYNQAGNILGDYNTDYTQLSNWFSSTSAVSQTDSNNTPPLIYHISIPKAKIEDAIVSLGSMDLKKSLIQYPQTALPGQFGNTVIFGHSVLPQFFNPKSYLTIFSTLYRLKQGDEIYIKYDGVNYKYIIDDMFEVQPTDLSVLEQRFDAQYLTLITCSPPGTYLRRLIIKAIITDY